MRQTKKWTDSDRATVAAMLRGKATSAKIADAFGVERNCIIGLVHRDKTLRAIGFNWRIAHPHRPVGERPKRVKRPPGQPRIRLSKIPGVLSLMPQKQSLLNFKPVPLPKPIPTVFECRSVPMLELRSRECRWPVNDAAVGEMHLFCGNPSEGSYCPGHARLGVGYGTRGEQLADRRNKPEFRRAA